MLKRRARLAVVAIAAPLSACALISPASHPIHRGFFDRDSVGGARCYAGETIARGGEQRVRGDSAWNRTVYLVLESIRWEDGRSPAHVIGSARPDDRIGATWVVTGDSLSIQEWGVMPEVSYLVREEGEELTGRAWMEGHTVGCIGGTCWGPRTSHWAIRARRIACTEVPREEQVATRDTLPG